MTLRDFFQNVPHFGRLALDHLLGRAHGMHIAKFLEPANDERLEEHERHLLRESALTELELGTDHNHGTARVIDAFAEKVLAETPTLALEHVAKGLERAIAGASDSAAMAAIIKERVDSFLQHALFVADNYFRRLELKQVLQPVVAVDDAAIQVVEVRRGKAAT